MGDRVMLANGQPVPPNLPGNEDWQKIDPQTGMQKQYIVLSDEERAKGFVRPVRTTYTHIGIRPKYPLRDLTEEEKKLHAPYNYVKYEEYPESELPKCGKFWTQAELDSGCGYETTMGTRIAETYAREPSFYGSTYCTHCQAHFRVDQFVWRGTNEVVGS